MGVRVGERIGEGMGAEFPRHVGGGWVETSDGSKHRGWDAARAHEAQITEVAVPESEAPDPPGRDDWRARKRRVAESKARANRVAADEAEPVTVTLAQVKANPARWGGGQWSARGIAEQIRFDAAGEAWVTVERNGEPIEIEFVGPSGPYVERVDVVVGRHPDFEVTGKTRKVEVAA